MELECTCHFNPENGFRLGVVCPKHDGVFTVPNPRPDFAQFAEQAEAEAHRLVELNRICHEPTCKGCHIRAERMDKWNRAERHARLLETIQKWANETGRYKYPELAECMAQAKAHIRSLLEQG